MNSKSKLILAVLIFVAGSVFAVWSLWGGTLRRAPAPAPVVVAPSPATLEDKAIIEGANFVVPGEGAPVERVVSAAMRKARLSVDALPSVDKLYPDRARALLEVAQDRLSLYLDPSWEVYASQVRSLTGNEPSVSREEWERQANGFIELPVAPESVRIQTRYRLGERRDTGVGRETYRRDGGTYCKDASLGHNVGIQNRRVDVYDLVVPMRFPDLMNPPDEFEGFLVLSFYWDVDRNRWIPWRTSIRNPKMGESGGHPRDIPPEPWL